MGATSVTGVGQGDVSGASRGSEHMTLAVGNLLGPKIVRAGSVTLVAGAANVHFGTLGGSASDYFVMLFDVTDGGASVVPSYNTLTTSNFVVAGDSTNVINWMVVEHGSAGSTV